MVHKRVIVHITVGIQIIVRNIIGNIGYLEYINGGTGLMLINDEITIDAVNNTVTEIRTGIFLNLSPNVLFKILLVQDLGPQEKP